MTSIAVWYTLVNEDGSSYQGATADKLNLRDHADVADFRDAVKLKNANKLATKDASDLLIYQDRMALHDGVPPLEPDVIISAYGQSKAVALVVVIPASPTTHAPPSGKSIGNLILT